MAEKPTGREQLLQAVIDHLAEHCVDNQSLRGIATSIGTSHRMLIYHFGSREGLLAEVVAAVEQMQRETFSVLTGTDNVGQRDLAELFWSRVIGPTIKYGPLFFELSAHAMQGRPHAEKLLANLVEPWLQILTDVLVAGGMDAQRARTQARLGLATVRGLLFDLLITGDRNGVDDSYRLLLDIISQASSDHRADAAPSPPMDET